MKHLRQALLLIVLISICLLTACGGDGDTSPSPSVSPTDSPTPTPTPTEEPTPGPGSPPRVTLHMSDGNEIVLELYPDKAPNTVANFLFRSDKENAAYGGMSYEGTSFESAVPNQRIQGGNPVGSILMEYTIKGEMSKNGFTQNDLTNVRGAVGMVRGESYDSAFAEFYILAADDPSMDGEYCVFGKVIKGMEHVDTYTNGIGSTYIESVTAETYGVDYKKDLELQMEGPIGAGEDGPGPGVEVEID